MAGSRIFARLRGKQGSFIMAAHVNFAINKSHKINMTHNMTQKISDSHYVVVDI